MLCICNFTPVVRSNYKIGVPEAGKWKILLNTDSSEFNGSNFLNKDEFESIDEGLHNHNQHIEIDLPPLSVMYLKVD